MNAKLLLYLIEDGEWHNLPELAEELGLKPEEATEMVRQLIQCHMVDFKEEPSQVRLQSWIRRLPLRVEVEGRKASVGNIIIPPNETVTIQNVVISNHTDIAIEIGTKITDEKLRELAITKVE